MSPGKTVYVPRNGSQQGSRQRTVPDQTEPISKSQRDKSGNKRRKDRGEKPRSILKVKLPKLTSRSLLGKLTKDNKTPARSSGKATNEKEKAKLSVLRTISKMMEENQFIRQRLAALNKAK